MGVRTQRYRKDKLGPQKWRKHQVSSAQLVDMIISMYSRGMTIKDIQSNFERIYDLDVLPDTVLIYTVFCK